MKANMIYMNQGCCYAVIAGKNTLFRATKLPNNFYNRILYFVQMLVIQHPITGQGTRNPHSSSVLARYKLNLNRLELRYRYDPNGRASQPDGPGSRHLIGLGSSD
jgi:hypothetical protein